jgi:hypothetical protein
MDVNASAVWIRCALLRSSPSVCWFAKNGSGEVQLLEDC